MLHVLVGISAVWKVCGYHSDVEFVSADVYVGYSFVHGVKFPKVPMPPLV